MNSELIKNNVLKTLLYYDIFSHPLKDEEVFTLLPQNSVPREKIFEAIEKFSCENDSPISYHEGYVYVKPNKHFIELRKEKEEISRKMWKAARIVTLLIKRFPYVRAVLVTGSLSKNSSNKKSDLDFMIITKKERLWVSRMLLMAFKKLFLFNSYKYFCINYFITEDNLEIEDKNIFTATEIVYIKPTFNSELMTDFIKANLWIKDYFPNYKIGDKHFNSPGFEVNNRKSYLQRFIELFFNGKLGDKLNEHFMKITGNHWIKKYKELDENERKQMFKTSPKTSTTHPRNMQKEILSMYNERLKKFNLAEYNG
ncbi:MAG: nucleotidyltransferase domain-containing protein [Ignavibacteriae bacterium]|nr:MAG: nucleotidyltransferase domain-containing protein [Ignavibacteriota bacterium]